MLKLLAAWGTLAFGFVVMGIAAEKMLGAGKWAVLSVAKCENDDEMPWRLDVRRHKLNRTHDGFDAHLVFSDDLDDSYAVHLDICKMMDGGCKPYMTIDDECLPKFLKKYAEDNVRAALAAGGLDPPDFPIAKGEHDVKNYMMDTNTLPREGLYGEYQTRGYIVKDGRYFACVYIVVRYTQSDDDPSPTQFG